MLSTYLGSSTTETASRRFSLEMPVIKIWSSAGTSLIRSIGFDNALNQGVYSDGPDWLPDPEQSPGRSVAVSGKVWIHTSRLRLRAVWEFVIPHPSFGGVSVVRPPITGFTELDLRALETYQVTGYRCEFLPHGAGGNDTAITTLYEAEVNVTRTARAGVMWQHEIALTVSGVNTTTTPPEDL